VIVNLSVIVTDEPIETIADAADLNVKSPATLNAPLGISIDVAETKALDVDVLVVSPYVRTGLPTDLFEQRFVK
jgi:hypothetical protein